MDIPDVLIDLCLLFYLKILDEWNVAMSHPKLKIDATNTIVKYGEKSEGGYGTRWRNAFGTVIYTKGDYDKVTFKVGDIPNQDRKSKLKIAVGIIDVNLWKSDMTGPFGSSAKQCGMAYYGGSGKRYINIDRITGKSYGGPWFLPDTITLTLDLRHDKFGKLSMKKGDTDHGVLYDKVDVNREYCIGTSIVSQCSVQLIQG